MHSPPLLQTELTFCGRRHDSVQEWIRDRRRTRWQRIGAWGCSRIFAPMLGNLVGLIERATVLRKVPAPVWTIVTMLISLGIYSLRMGWMLATGFIILLLVHECGHLLAACYYGARTSVPIFIPYLGAVIDMKDPMQNAWEEAVFGISGPILGTLGAVTCLMIHRLTGIYYFTEIAFFGLFLNLFNLIPLGCLDGGHIAVALTRWLWIPGYLILAVFAWHVHTPVVILSLAVMLPMVFSLFRKKTAHQLAREYSFRQISLPKRLLMGTLYVGLVAFLAVTMWRVWCNDIIPALHDGKGLFPAILAHSSSHS